MPKALDIKIFSVDSWQSKGFTIFLIPISAKYFLNIECMDSLEMLIRGYQDRAMDLVNLKINRIGGLTKERQFKDLCISLGIAMTIEDSWGGEIATAAIAHLAHATHPDYHFQSSAFHEYHSIAIANGGPKIEDGYMFVDDSPGLGVTPDYTKLGNPVFVVQS